MTILGITLTAGIIWIIVAVVFAIIEAITVSLTTLWFVVGGIVAAIVSLFTENFVIQVVIFLVVSVILLITTRPILVKKMKLGKEQTNIGALIGKHTVVTKEINTIVPGEVKVGALTWIAIADHDISKGTEVIIKRIEGVKLEVEEK